jgi:hypothetical protein
MILGWLSRERTGCRFTRKTQLEARSIIFAFLMLRTEIAVTRLHLDRMAFRSEMAVRPLNEARNCRAFEPVGRETEPEETVCDRSLCISSKIVRSTELRVTNLSNLLVGRLAFLREVARLELYPDALPRERRVPAPGMSDTVNVRSGRARPVNRGLVSSLELMEGDDFLV